MQVKTCVGLEMRTIQEGYQLLASALRTKCESNGRESANSVQAEEDIVVLHPHVSLEIIL